MTDPTSTMLTLADRARIVSEAEGQAIVGVHFLRQTPVFVLGEEALLFAPAEKRTRVMVHDGGILASAAGPLRIVTGGDDGKLVATDKDGNTETLATDERKRWIDQVALGPDGAVAWSTGKIARVRTSKGEVREIQATSTVGGLAFFPKGFRVAVAHYNGVTLWFPNAAGAKPETLEWKGSHLGVTLSPDGRFLITQMQEPTLHGWRLVDSKHMRMSGYSARVRSLSWSHDGGLLATSGSEQLILWPFDGKDGPMGKQPTMFAPSPSRCTRVACHPKQPVTAAGFADGTVLLVRLEDGALILAREADGQPISALSWDQSGQVLAFGTEQGDARVLTL
ncbi:WD40 repeat domain-containing protein [Pseudolabrys sp. FHR47]|uniref:WD40 repeat domain-containing protein n=1 Tax=Pseudolabrys sp. FHR47 TaxID=2562284 RepID=UPI0010BE3345|nr:WD40 repeat domain-containing protein [Pseudolabrys sp. FHR47]